MSSSMKFCQPCVLRVTCKVIGVCKNQKGGSKERIGEVKRVEKTLVIYPAFMCDKNDAMRSIYINIDPATSSCCPLNDKKPFDCYTIVDGVLVPIEVKGIPNFECDRQEKRTLKDTLEELSEKTICVDGKTALPSEVNVMVLVITLSKVPVSTFAHQLLGPPKTQINNPCDKIKPYSFSVNSLCEKFDLVSMIRNILRQNICRTICLLLLVDVTQLCK